MPYISCLCWLLKWILKDVMSETSTINLSINEYWHPNLSLGRRWACLWPGDPPRPWGSDLFKISSVKKRKQTNGKEDAVICAQMPDFVKIFPDYSTAKTAPGGEICKFTNATWCWNVVFEKWTWWKIKSFATYHC